MIRPGTCHSCTSVLQQWTRNSQVLVGRSDITSVGLSCQKIARRVCPLVRLWPTARLARFGASAAVSNARLRLHRPLHQHLLLASSRLGKHYETTLARPLLPCLHYRVVPVLVNGQASALSTCDIEAPPRRGPAGDATSPKTAIRHYNSYGWMEPVTCLGTMSLLARVKRYEHSRASPDLFFP